MAGLLSVMVLPGLLLAAASVTDAATYYVDPSGSDANDGTAPARAWRTLERASLVTLGPGDRLLFRSGARFVGGLTIQAAGKRGRPAVVGKYGCGTFPQIASGGKADSAVEIRNSAHVIVEDLEITNEPPDGTRRDGLYGVRIVADKGGEFGGILLRRLHVHHVLGGWDRHGGAGIGCIAAGDSPRTGAKRSRFAGLRIEDCYVHDVSFYGMFVSGWDNRFRDSRWYPSRNVVVRNNLLHDIGGDAIVLIATDKSVMEHNEAYRTSLGQQNGGRTPSGGIWPHSSNGAVVRYNRVSGINGQLDCEPYDVDINCRDTLIEHNISEANSGGFLLLCSSALEKAPTYHAVIRNNLSIGDGFESGRLITAVGVVSDVTIENNVFIGSTARTINILGGWESDEYPWCRGITFRRNIFFTEGVFTFDVGGMQDIKMAGNAYTGRFLVSPNDPDGLFADIDVSVLTPGVPRNLTGEPFSRIGFVPFDITMCGVTDDSPWLSERDRQRARSGH